MSIKPHIVTTYFKVKVNRDEDYKAFIRGQPCIICGCRSEHHHEPLNGRGVGEKGPDNESLPLCFTHHIAERHRWGRETFFNRYGIDWRELVNYYQKLYKVIF